MSDSSDILIVGAGIVGLATAYQLRKKYPHHSITILEKEEKIAQHQSSHNSGVIHSGVYYQPGSQKAKNCVRGYQLLLDFCRKYEIPFDLCGKVIVASTPEEIPLLDAIYQKGIQNGLNPLKQLTSEEIREKEPRVSGLKGIWVPQAGCISYAAVADQLAETLGSQDVQILCNHKVLEIKKQEVISNQSTFRATLIITCGGLYSDHLVRNSGLNLDFRILPFRGEYYVLKPEVQDWVNGLVYPVPDPDFPFLGVHFTKTIHGTIEAGPNAVLAFRREAYRWNQFHAGEFWETIRYSGFRKLAARHWRQGLTEQKRSLSKNQFCKALQKLIPEIKPEHLESGGAGVRAQACRPDGSLVDDFLFVQRPGLIHVANAPSPAATASLSVGLTIADLAGQQLT